MPQAKPDYAAREDEAAEEAVRIIRQRCPNLWLAPDGRWLACEGEAPEPAKPKARRLDWGR
jgi:hypothetical protein